MKIVCVRKLSVCLAVLLLGMAGAWAEDAVDRVKLVPGDPIADALKFVTDDFVRQADEANVVVDRHLIAADVNNTTALTGDVRKFFSDLDSINDITNKIAADRKQFRVDIAITPPTGPLQKPGTGSSDLNAAVTQFQTDFNARVTAEAAVDTDMANLNISVLAKDKAGVTTNGNAFFHDNFNFNQARIYEGADVVNIKKVIKFHAQKPVFTKPAHGKDLSTHAAQFIKDRATYLSDELALTGARNSMFAVLPTSSLSSSVTTWLNARRQVFYDTTQLTLDRLAMRVDLHLGGRKALKNLLIKLGLKSGGGEDSGFKPSDANDQTDDTNGEK